MSSPARAGLPLASARPKPIASNPTVANLTLRRSQHGPRLYLFPPLPFRCERVRVRAGFDFRSRKPCASAPHQSGAGSATSAQLQVCQRRLTLTIATPDLTCRLVYEILKGATQRSCSRFSAADLSDLLVTLPLDSP